MYLDGGNKMKLACARFAAIALVSLATSMAQASNDILLRILIEKISPGSVFTINDDKALADSINCSYKTGLSGATLWANPFVEIDKWQCQSSSQKINLDASIHVHSYRKVFDLLGETYRGHIELLPTKDSLYVINHVPLDAYLASLANSEMSASFPTEALKAQVIAARSYALATALERRKKNLPFDLYNTQFDQVYKGVKYETPKSWQLAKETSKQILNFSRKVLKAYYHSSSGGHLELPMNVWGRSDTASAGAYLAKPNPYDKNLNGGTWTITLSKDLGSQIKASGVFREIKTLDRTEGKRVKRLEIIGDKGRTQISGVQFRNLFGAGWIKSALFDIKKRGSSFVIEGKGWGHGVGMSQWGAKVMADSGKSAEQILKFYYPNANVAVYGRSNPSSRTAKRVSSTWPTPAASAR
jgi:stage II sporulation protein D